MGAEIWTSVVVSLVSRPCSALASVCPTQPPLPSGLGHAENPWPSARHKSECTCLGRLGMKAVALGDEICLDPLMIAEANAVGSPCD